MTGFDKRITPARPDLAAAHLKGRVEAGCFVEGRLLRVIEEVIGVRPEPNPEASLDTQALFGEDVMVYEDHEGWAWGQLLRDGYVGYFPANALRAPGPAPTHRVAVPRSFAWPGVNIKLPVVTALPLGARLAVREMLGEFGRLADGSFVLLRHLALLDAPIHDFVSVAEQFLHVPYLWGGKTSLGLDCSGLLQVSLDAAGINAPRDSDMLLAAIGQPLEITPDHSGLVRGDLLFWRGHCGIMRDGKNLLHANGYHMQVASEPLHQASARILANSYGPVTAVKRLVPIAPNVVG